MQYNTPAIHGNIIFILLTFWRQLQRLEDFKPYLSSFHFFKKLSPKLYSKLSQYTRTSRIELSCLPYLPMLWPVRQSGAAVEHNDVIVTLGLLRKQHEAQSGTILQTIFKDIFGKGDMIKNKFWNLLTFKNRIASAKLAAQRADWHIMKMITTTNKVTVVGLWYLCFWTSKQILRKSRKNFSYLFKIFKSRLCENSLLDFLDITLIFRNIFFWPVDRNLKVFTDVERR